MHFKIKFRSRDVSYRNIGFCKIYRYFSILAKNQTIRYNIDISPNTIWYTYNRPVVTAPQLEFRLLIFSRSLQFKKKNLEKIVTQKGLRNEEKMCDLT